MSETPKSQSWDDYWADRMLEGLTTGKIILAVPNRGEFVIQWYLTDDCLPNCRDFGSIGQIHQIGCPNIPPREYFK